MKKKSLIYQPSRIIVPRQREHRGSRHQRGYDSVWTRRAAKHLKRFPVCAECENNGFVTVAAVVDHKIPIEFQPDLRLDPKNWWSLCNGCHNGFKRRLEAVAVRRGEIDKLIFWCDNPSDRPEEVRYAKAKRPKEEYVV